EFRVPGSAFRGAPRPRTTRNSEPGTRNSSSELDGVEVLEEADVGFPAVELGVGVGAEGGAGRGRVVVEQAGGASAADQDARLAVAGGEDAQAPGVEVEGG